MSGGDWFHLIVFGVALVGAAVGLYRRLTHADEADIKRRIAAADGATVVWAKRLDTQKGDILNPTTTFYDVLVERNGVRRIEVWRDSLDGLSKDH